ncbi:MAG TPA: hypothetical protein VJU02_00875, partial [Nitrospiraceae bacterium]|nr:hypothetical protein [Nitrospiraceae bacterium]
AAWLAEERNILAIVPKDSALRPFTPNPLQERALLYLQVIILPATMVFSGIMVWRRRRRL